MEHRAQRYEICVEELLDESWTGWFGGMTLAWTAKNHTVLSGALRDQAELHGVLAKLRDLGLTLITVRRIEPAEDS